MGLSVEVSESSNGEMGLRTLMTFKPHFVIVDFHMPILDGQEFCQKARGLSYDGPIIMVTGEDRDRVRDKLRKNHIYYLQKPNDMSQSYLCDRFTESLQSFVRGFVARIA